MHLAPPAVLLMRAANNSCCYNQVYRSALDLLGEVLHCVAEPTDPPLDTFLDVIRSVLEWPQTDETTRNVAIDSLARATGNR